MRIPIFLEIVSLDHEQPQHPPCYDDSWNWDPIEEEISPEMNAPPFCLETVPTDDESLDEPARTETHDDAIEMFPMRNETTSGDNNDG